MATRAWNENTPASGDSLGEGDDRIRESKFDIRERLQLGGHVVATGGPYVPTAGTDKDGRHAVANGGDHPVGFKVYKSDQVTPLVDFSDTGVTIASGAPLTADNVTSGTDPGHKHNGTIAMWVPGAVLPGRLKAVFRAPKPLTFAQVHIHVMTRHTGGGNLLLNVKLLSAPANSLDRLAAAGISIQALADRPILAPSGDFHNAGNSTFSTGSMNADDELVFDIENDGGAWTTNPSDIVIHVDVIG